MTFGGDLSNFTIDQKISVFDQCFDFDTNLQGPYGSIIPVINKVLVVVSRQKWINAGLSSKDDVLGGKII